jgi:hypothetical protein
MLQDESWSTIRASSFLGVSRQTSRGAAALMV